MKRLILVAVIVLALLFAGCDPSPAIVDFQEPIEGVPLQVVSYYSGWRTEIQEFISRQNIRVIAIERGKGRTYIYYQEIE